MFNSFYFMGVLACSAGGFWWGEWIDISIGCSGRHLDIVESWGEVKNLPSVGERKKNWEGGGGGERKIFSLPRPPPLQHSVILAPILPVCSESKIVANHSIDHQNRLHCRLWVSGLFDKLDYITMLNYIKRFTMLETSFPITILRYS